MSIEVEIKAWVDDFQTIKGLLDSKYQFVKEYTKEDLYFKGMDSISQKEKEVRIRRVDGSSIVTYKERSHQGKVEVNIEKEFKVDNYDNFKYLIEELGYRAYITKTKTGFLYNENGINIELSNVTGLGYFIEIESVIDEDGDVNRETRRIYEILDSLKISRDRVEDQFYVEMLLDRKNRS